MQTLKSRLIAAVRKIDGVEDRPSPVSGGCALFYRGREFAHFHNDTELDLRLTKKQIKAEALAHPKDSVHHVGRAAGSPWIELRFNSIEQVEQVARLVLLATREL